MLADCVIDVFLCWVFCSGNLCPKITVIIFILYGFYLNSSTFISVICINKTFRFHKVKDHSPEAVLVQ